MTLKQREIAEEAIARQRAQTYGQIQEEVAHIRGIGVDIVKTTIDDLVGEHILKECATPAGNIAAGEVAGEITWAWYEKGGAWPES